MDNLFLKITGSVNIPVPLDMDTDYGFGGAIAIYGSDMRTNGDGTQSITYKGQFTEGIQLIKGDKIVQAKTKLSQSQMFRRECMKRGIEYDDIMTWLRHPERINKLFDSFERYAADTTPNKETD